MTMTNDNSKQTTCLVAVNISSCIGTNILIAYFEDCTIQAIMLGSNIETLYLKLVISYPHLKFVQMFDSRQSKILVEKLDRYILNPKQNHLDFDLKIKGTEFQKLVWCELCKIGFGTLQSYADIGRPKSVRAVANACARNNIPIIMSDGTYGGYSAGKDIKAALIKLEQDVLSSIT